MKFSEFETASDKGARVYKKKQADKEKLKKQREWVRNSSGNKDEESVKADVLTAIDKLLSYSDDKSIKITTIKADTL
jgi:hypothetical protein